MKPGTPGFYALKEDCCMRAAVYSGTKNVYEQMLTASKSLLMHSNVEKIYFLIEDDEFPFELPPEVECRNISNQKWFPSDGPNIKKPWDYMVLIRLAYTKIFPELDTILTIDIDTIVNENVSDLWDIDLTNYYLAGVKEIITSKMYDFAYINMGVAMMNLKKIRDDGIDDKMIDAVNKYFYYRKEQDCINEFCHNNIFLLPSDYNVNCYVDPPLHEKITHYAGLSNYDDFPYFKKYKNMLVKDIKRNIPDRFDLDIIIPTYKNKEGLRRTLDSITPNNNVYVTVVDDASDLEYSDILKEYPALNLYIMGTNSGPGMARQYGIEHTSAMYIVFLDTGDYFYENGLEHIMAEIQANTYIKFYSFSYVYDNNNLLEDHRGNKTIGNVFKRSLIEAYNVHFIPEGSYMDEDFGFVRTCLSLTESWEAYHWPTIKKHIKIPVFYEHVDKNSITKRNNNEVFFTKLIPGLLINGASVIEQLRINHIQTEIIISEVNFIFAYAYSIFLCVIAKRPELAADHWQIMREYYLNTYQYWEKASFSLQPTLTSKIIVPILLKHCIKPKFRVNFKTFIEEISTSDACPERYIT